MSLRSDLNGTFSLEDLKRLMFPVTWSGTKDRAEGEAEEAELRAFAADAAAKLQANYTERGDGESDYAVRVEAGEIVEIVEVAAPAPAAAPATAVVDDLVNGVHGQSELRLVGEFLRDCLEDAEDAEDVGAKAVYLRALGWLEDAVAEARAAIESSSRPCASPSSRPCASVAGLGGNVDAFTVVADDAGHGQYAVAVYFRGDVGESHYHALWSGYADSPADARRKALDAYQDTRIDGWEAEVVGCPGYGDEEDEEDEEDEDDEEDAGWHQAASP